MKKIYNVLLLMVALICLPLSVKAATTVFEEGFEGDLSGWTKQSCHSSTGIGTEAKYSGSKGFLFYYNTNPPQYLISNELSVPSGASDLSVELYYKAYSSYGTEKFQVGYSTTTADVTGDGVFTWDTEISTSSTSWAQYTNSITFPKETKFIAIRYNANDQYRLYIDDINVTCTISGPSMAVLDGETALTSGYTHNFGLATAGTTKVFTLKNDGTEAAPISVSHTGDFGAELSAASIPAGGSVDLTVTMPATSGSDVITISSTSEAIADFTLNVSGTVRDASKLWCNFSEGLPEGWTNGGYTILTSGAGEGTSGAGYAKNSAYSYYRLSTPKLIVAEGEKFYLSVCGNGSTASWNTLTVQYSANGTDWTDAKAISDIAYNTWTTVEVTEIPAGNYYIGFYGRYAHVTDIYGGTLPAAVKNVTATGVTDTEATISWTAHGSEAAWQVSYSTTSGDPDNGTIVDADATTKALSGLSATTTYYVSVRIGTTGVWSNEISFTTACGAETAPVKWTFESETANAVPTCWDNSASTAVAGFGSYPYYNWGVYSASGNKSLRMYNTSLKAGTSLINTPSIVIPAAPAAYELAFEYSHKASCGAFTVNVSEDGGANWVEKGSYANETGSNSSSPADFIEATIDLTSYAGKTILVQFFATADYDAGAIFVDNVEIRAKSNCPAPKNVLVSSVTDHTAQVAWTEKGEATAWKLQTSQNGTDWSAAIDADANPFTLTGLDAETTYYVRVAADCGGETSDWSDASEPFDTKCEAKTLPFEKEEFDAIPACWSVASGWELYTYDGSIRVKSSTADLTMPAITLSEKAQLSFKISSSSSIKCYVYVNDGENEVKEGEATATSSWKQATVDLSDYVGKTVNITFRSSSASYYLYLDDVEITYAPADAPTNVVAEPKDGKAIVTWESSDEATSWNLQYREAGATDWTAATGTIVSPFTLEGLTNGTEYEIQVKAIVNENRKSDWSASANVTPVACASVTGVTFGERTYNSIVVNWTADAEADSWFIQYKPVDESTWIFAAGITEKTIKLTNLVTEKEYTVDVKASCGQTWFTAPETFTLAYTAPVATVSNITDQDAVVSWTAVADADSYLFRGVVKGTGIDWTKATAIPKDNPSVTFSGLSPNAEYDVYVGAVYGEHIEAAEMVSFTSITIAPKNLAVSDIKATSATLTWDYEGAATSFEYALGDDADNLSWLAGESPLALTELLANTSYTFYVRAAYDNGAKSDSIKLTFHTECAAFTIPFEENFNGLTSGTIPECWDNSEGTTTWAAYKWSYYVSGHEGACVRFDSYNNANGNTNILATPAITVDKAAVLKFWCKNYKGGAFEVLISEVGAAERDTLLEELTGIENWTEKEVEIPAKFIGKDVRIFFCGTSNYGFNQNAYSLYVDDVTVTEKPTCLKPTNLTASNVLYNSAELSWTANSGETAWNLEIKVADGEWTPVDAVITNPYALTGLESGKIHYARVQAACTTEDHSEWSNEVSFTPAYKAPTNVIVNNVTTNSATISWTANSGETAWKIQYNKAGSSTAHEEDATANPYVLEGLDSGTSYEVRVVAGTTAFSAYVDFTTTCEAVANLPWSENFESAVTNAAPNCWALLNAQFASKDTRPYIAVAANSGYYQDSKALFFRSEEDFGFAILPEFNMALDTAQITFSHIEDSGIGNLVFGYITDITDASTFVAILECTASSTWKTETAVALTKVPNGVRLAFKHNNAGASYYYDAAVDNILIEAIPACAVPTNLAVLSVTDHSASLSFDSEAESFNYMIRKQGVETWDGGAVTITSTTFTIDELEPNTTYEVTVHAVCAGTSTSSLWTAEVAFTTDCATRTMPYEVAFAEGTPECWTLDGKNDAWKVSNENLRFSANSNVPGVATLPNVHISGTNPVIRLNYSNVYGTRTIAASIHVVAADADSTFTLVDHSALADAELRLDAFVDKDVTITLNLGNTTGTAYFDLKYFNVNNKQFVAPTNVAAVAGIGEATLTWEAGDNETSWEVYYYEKAKEEDQTSYQFITDVTTTSCTISGLANGVTYAARVKAIYEGGTSIGSVAAEFTTLLPQPTALEVSALGAHTATLSWTAAEGVAKYQWSLTEGEWLEANVVETTSVDLTELDANKAYTFFVRSYVSETISSEAISKAFTTDCDVVAMPFVEDFNSLTIGQIPTCWERTDATYTWTYYADGHDGACVRFDSYLNAAGNKDTLATPQIAISGEEPVLNFFFKNPDGGDFTVAIETATDTIALISEGLTGVANWQDTTVALSAYIGQTVRIFFLATSNEHDYAAGVDAHLYLDDVKVIEKPETPTAIDNIFGMDSKNAVKFVENGVLYILRDGVIYNAQGARVNK